MKKINQFGVNLYQPYTVYPATSTNRLIFNLRSREAYHGERIESTISIPYDKNFINQIGWYLNCNQEINLIGDYHLVSKATHNILYSLLDMIMCLDISYHKLKFKHNLFIVKA